MSTLALDWLAGQRGDPATAASATSLNLAASMIATGDDLDRTRAQLLLNELDRASSSNKNSKDAAAFKSALSSALPKQPRDLGQEVRNVKDEQAVALDVKEVAAEQMKQKFGPDLPTSQLSRKLCASLLQNQSLASMRRGGSAAVASLLKTHVERCALEAELEHQWQKQWLVRRRHLLHKVIDDEPLVENMPIFVPVPVQECEYSGELSKELREQIAAAVDPKFRSTTGSDKHRKDDAELPRVVGHSAMRPSTLRRLTRRTEEEILSGEDDGGFVWGVNPEQHQQNEDNIDDDDDDDARDGARQNRRKEQYQRAQAAEIDRGLMQLGLNPLPDRGTDARTAVESHVELLSIMRSMQALIRDQQKMLQSSRSASFSVVDDSHHVATNSTSAAASAASSSFATEGRGASSQKKEQRLWNRGTFATRRDRDGSVFERTATSHALPGPPPPLPPPPPPPPPPPSRSFATDPPPPGPVFPHSPAIFAPPTQEGQHNRDSSIASTLPASHSVTPSSWHLEGGGASGMSARSFSGSSATTFDRQQLQQVPRGNSPDPAHDYFCQQEQQEQRQFDLPPPPPPRRQQNMNDDDNGRSSSNNNTSNSHGATDPPPLGRRKKAKEIAWQNHQAFAASLNRPQHQHLPQQQQPQFEHQNRHHPQQHQQLHHQQQYQMQRNQHRHHHHQQQQQRQNFTTGPVLHEWPTVSHQPQHHQNQEHQRNQPQRQQQQQQQQQNQPAPALPYDHAAFSYFDEN